MIMIQNYRDDQDLQNMIDWIQQTWLHCCGVNNYRNWESNIYFNCSSKNIENIEACSVPASCCRLEYFHVKIKTQNKEEKKRFSFCFQIEQ